MRVDEDALVRAHTPPGAEEHHRFKELDYAQEYGWDDPPKPRRRRRNMSERTGTYARSQNMAATIIAGADTDDYDIGQVAEAAHELGVLLFNLQDAYMEEHGLYGGNDGGARSSYQHATSKKKFGGKTSSNGFKGSASTQSGSKGMSPKQRETIVKNLRRLEEAGVEYYDFDHFEAKSGKDLSDAIGELFEFVNENAPR